MTPYVSSIGVSRALRRFAPRAAGAILLLLGSAGAARATSATPTTVSLHARLTTNKGCLETGDAAEFAVGERMAVLVRVDSATAGQAAATLFSFKGDGTVNVVSLGAIPANIPFAVLARVGPPPGVHQLLLKASAGGVTSTRACSFRVVDAGTRTPTAIPTETPTATQTPAVSATATPTGNAGLQPHLTTGRGCIETGDDPQYHLGELITVSFDVASATYPRVSATLDDILANGFVNVLSLGDLATNHPYSFRARIAPPTGTETLKLRARVFGGTSASTTCSFTVVP
jgi:hypothetical protein